MNLHFSSVTFRSVKLPFFVAGVPPAIHDIVLPELNTWFKMMSKKRLSRTRRLHMYVEHTAAPHHHERPT